jgi:Fe2+ or Zn2+ uptake regulation protein
MAERLRERGIQPSQQRIRIYEALACVRTHPSAEAVYRSLLTEMPTLSRTTVFNSLDLFARAGLAQRLSITGSDVRYDADCSRHVHFRCRSCQAVQDIPGLPAPGEPRLPGGYVLESSQFFLEGLCPACSEKGS